ncbi:hypothetical protein CPB84DRAFT_1774017 [Gymnopilus junonius]|uniref:Uncharacterized protein n=1 Tax=Gymnopilus junonius TaxID=109634 RepID=A0A9P5TPS0_GYMJU|nr:hypothetical protein CPB84DRAFT_1774017 [Gymnopilus junonius]
MKIGERPPPAPAPPVRKKSSRLAATPYTAASPSAEGAKGRKARAGRDLHAVLYEDPAQKEEQKRLMSLLKSQDESQGSLRRRKSARIAGFEIRLSSDWMGGCTGEYG